MSIKVILVCVGLLLVCSEYVGCSNNKTQGEICEEKTGVLLSALINKTPIPDEYSYVQKFAFYSGILFDIGDYKNCKKLDGAQYNLVLLNVPSKTNTVTGQPFFTILNGLCYFKECDTSYINNAKLNLIAFANKMLNTTLNSTIPNETIMIVDPEKTNDDYKEKYVTGMVVVIIFLVILVVLNILYCVLKFMGKFDHESKPRQSFKPKPKHSEVEEETKESNDNDSKSKINEQSSLAVTSEVKTHVKSSVNYTSDNDAQLSQTSKEKDIDRPFILHHDTSKHKKKKKPSIFLLLISCFDFIGNAKKILNTDTKDKSMLSLRVFDGVRVLSIGWVVAGHGFLILGYSGVVNFADLLTFFQSFQFPFLASAFFAVDVFFYMSGFLFYLGLQKYLNKDISKVKIILMALVHRYIRLLPLYLFAIFGIMYFLPFLGSGPMFTFSENFIKCESDWWKNLLYINNFTNNPTGCVAVGWYLANDFQFFIISIAVFIIFNRSKMIRDVIFGGMFIITLVLSIVLTVICNFSYNDYSHHYDNVKGSSFNDYYIRPYIRITPYIIGLYFAELYMHTPVYIESKQKQLHAKKEKNTSDLQVSSTSQSDNVVEISESERNKHESANEQLPLARRFNDYLLKNNVACYCIFVFCIGLMNFSVLSTYITNNYEVPMALHGFFSGFNKVFFVGTLAMILHLTFLGKLRFIYSILSFKVFTPLARITFGIYLVHFYLEVIFYNSITHIFYFSFSSCFILYVGFFVIATIISFFLSLILESPLIGILKKTMGGGAE